MYDTIANTLISLLLTVVNVVPLWFFAGLLAWFGLAFSNEKHPNLQTNEYGIKYCPALKALHKAEKEAQKASRETATKTVDPVAQIERLVELKNSGHLSESEFQIQKSRLLL